jgi:hypothetical protein
MSEWYNSQKKPSSNFRKLLQERLDKTNYSLLVTMLFTLTQAFMREH